MSQGILSFASTMMRVVCESIYRKRVLRNWGDFDVTINIDKDCVAAASGYLQNPELIGHG